MADDRAGKDAAGVREDREQPSGEDVVADQSADEAVDWSSWNNLWQIPAIAVSAVVIAVGLYVAMMRAPKNDFQGAFDLVDRLIETEQFDLAATRLNEVVEPNLADATGLEQARFEATVADWISLSQNAAELDLEVNNRRIVYHYGRASDMGLPMSPARLERWAHAWISLGEFDATRQSLDRMEKMAASAGDQGGELRRRRNAVLRRLVEFSLRQSDFSEESMTELLVGYRTDPLISSGDELWAIARQAELRIESGHADDAVAHLLIDMRRFEPELDEMPDLSFGELFALLARGYYELGNFPYAEYHVQQAMETLRGADPARASALVLLGQIAVTQGRWHDAFELFDEVVREYATSRSGIPGRLGRAEVYSVLGDDQRSLDDYTVLRDAIVDGRPRRDVTPDDIARSLSDRHDAALTMEKLDAALQYVLLAEKMYALGHVPAELIFRVASTSRQLADNAIADAGNLDPGIELRHIELRHIDPALRFGANEHYRRAGDYFVRHARELAGRPGADEHWADSLWLAADSYDLGGWHDLAISHFVEYVSGRSEADPRRPDAVFRLAVAHHAEMDYESAARYYEQVLTEHPRSHVASRSHVPLARCLLMLGRRPEAEQHMIEVVTGQQHLAPDAVDYRDALIELGSLYYDDEDYVGAIERLDEAVRRYPDDPRIHEIRFRLADSYRRHAASLARDRGLPGVSPVERDRLETERTGYLDTAQQLFGAIIRDDEASAVPGAIVDDQILRYAYLYRADCAFELGRYAEAVELYDQVASRFTRHHSSMTALIQIVNCYSKLGDLNRARTAHRRALLRLKKLPDEAFAAPDVLLDREAWERWLQNMPAGPVDGNQAASAAG